MIITIDTDKLAAEYAEPLPAFHVAGVAGIFKWLACRANEQITENITKGAITLDGGR